MTHLSHTVIFIRSDEGLVTDHPWTDHQEQSINDGIRTFVEGSEGIFRAGTEKTPDSYRKKLAKFLDALFYRKETLPKRIAYGEECDYISRFVV